MLYHVDFKVEYPANMSQKDLFKIWFKEAQTALSAKKSGTVVDLWKAVGMRRVIAIVDVDSPDTLDRILMDLPIMQELGHHVTVEVTSLRRYEDFTTDLESRI
ncbi:MAG: muconolactone Delta-isomerase [Prochloraceae cyanobacterium]